jgi:hypothetical protein
MHFAIFCRLAMGLLFFLALPTHSMDYQLTPVQNQTLQVVLLNCLQRHDFEGVSHIIEKMPIQPGTTFIQMLKDELSPEHFKAKTIDYCYELFKYTAANDLYRVNMFLKNQKLLIRVLFFAQTKRDHKISCKILGRKDFIELIELHQSQFEQ